MSLKDEFRKMVTELTIKFTPPPIANIFFPPLNKGGQPRDAQFMAISLEGGATGVSFVLLSGEKKEEYDALRAPDFVEKNPRVLALEFGNEDPIKEMLSLAAINAICQYVMRATNFMVDSATDSLGLLSVSAGDRVGMVGLFSGLIKTIKEAGAELIVIEKNEQLIKKYPDLPITLDMTKLSKCNKVLCTSTTIIEQFAGLNSRPLFNRCICLNHRSYGGIFPGSTFCPRCRCCGWKSDKGRCTVFASDSRRKTLGRCYPKDLFPERDLRQCNLTAM